MNMEKATQKDRILGKITQRSNRTRTSASKGQKEHKDKDKKRRTRTRTKTIEKRRPT